MLMAFLCINFFRIHLEISNRIEDISALRRMLITLHITKKVNAHSKSYNKYFILNMN